MPDVVTPEQFQQFLQQVEQEFPHISLQPVLKQCVELIRADVKGAFRDQVSPDGRPWPPADKPQGHPLLNETGRLFQSAVLPGPGHIEEVTDHSIVFGTIVPYAAFHQNGTRFLPERAFLGASSSTIEHCVELIMDYLAEQIMEML